MQSHNVGDNTTIRAHFEPRSEFPFRRVHYYVGTILSPGPSHRTPDPAANNLATPKHRIASPFPYSDRTPDASTTQPTECNNAGHLEKTSRLSEPPYGPGFDSASKRNKYQE